MTDEQPEIVIRADDGTEHVFPPGFDPMRAAAIVRAGASEREPDTFQAGFTKSLKDQGRTLAKGALDALPGIGAMVGGALSTPETLGAGTIPGIALGAGVGRGARDLIGAATGLDAPTTPLQKAGGIAGETAIAGGTAAVLPGLVSAVKAPIQTLREGAEQFGSAMPTAIRRLGRLFPSVGKAEAGPILQRPPWQTWQEAPAAEPIAPTATGTAMPSTPAAAGPTWQQFQTQQVPASRLASAAPAAAAPTEEMVGGVPISALRKAGVGEPALQKMRGNIIPTDRPPVQVDQASLPDAWKPLTQPHPLDPQRVDVGAEVTGRANGLTKQQVRDVATPIAGEAQGEASPILPQAALTRIIDTMKSLPPGGPERDAYVLRATAGKSRGQIENIRRTLEHLGLIVPVAAAAPSVRDLVMQRLQGNPGQ